MTTIVEAMDAVTAALEAGGVRCVVDERDVNPPCAYLLPPAVTYRFNKGGWQGSWVVLAIVPDSGRRVSTGNLDELMAQINTALAGVVSVATPSSFVGVDGAPALPAYELRFTQTYY